MPKYLVRFEMEATRITQVRKQLEKIAPELKPRLSKIELGMSRADRLHDAMMLVEDAKGEIESLKDEMESWRDNLPENMQDSSKASELDDAVSQLEAVYEALENATSEADTVSFPGMMG